MSHQVLTPKILVVEDECLIQDLLQAALEDAGYAVLLANDGCEGVELVEAQGAHFAAIVTDINLGTGKTGWDVARRARELSGTIPVVYISGDSSHEWCVKGVPHSVMVTKPFAPGQLVVALASIVDRTDPDR